MNEEREKNTFGGASEKYLMPYKNNALELSLQQIFLFNIYF
jgi:hypothetical protein